MNKAFRMIWVQKHSQDWAEGLGRAGEVPGLCAAWPGQHLRAPSGTAPLCCKGLAPAAAGTAQQGPRAPSPTIPQAKPERLH